MIELIERAKTSLQAAKLSDVVKFRLLQSLQFAISLKARGRFAEFSLGQTSPHKHSAATMPPSVCAGMFSSIVWKPPMKWLPLCIVSHAFPRTLTITRREPITFAMDKNGTGVMISKGNKGFHMITHTLLRDVEYSVVAIPYVTGNSARETARKFYDMFMERIKRGQYFQPPVLGTTPCFADLSLEPLPSSGADGFNEDCRMFYGWRGQGRKLEGTWFDAKIKNGVMKCIPWEVLDEQSLALFLSPDRSDWNDDGSYVPKAC